mgnify:CR=1 FL=1
MADGHYSGSDFWDHALHSHHLRRGTGGDSGESNFVGFTLGYVCGYLGTNRNLGIIPIMRKVLFVFLSVCIGIAFLVIVYPVLHTRVTGFLLGIQLQHLQYQKVPLGKIYFGYPGFDSSSVSASAQFTTTASPQEIHDFYKTKLEKTAYRETSSNSIGKQLEFSKNHLPPYGLDVIFTNTSKRSVYIQMTIFDAGTVHVTISTIQS